MDVPAIFSELSDHGFEDTASTRKLSILNDVVADVCAREAWPFLEAQAELDFVAKNDTPALPGDFRAALSVIIPGYAVLTPERLDTMTKTYMSSSATAPSGVPYLYYFVGSSLRVYPTPDKAYIGLLTYLRDHPVLTATSQETDILLPRRHHRVLVLGCLSKLYAMEDDPELGTVFTQQYEQRIQTIEQDLWKRQWDRTDRVVDVFDDPYMFGY